MIRATWCTSGNIGDRLNPWLIQRITGQQPLYVDQNDPIPKHLCCGSILGWASPTTTVWGAGILNQDDKVHRLADIRAVRGPLSRERALECGAECRPVYGDPAWLVPLFLPHRRTDDYAVGFIPHYVDQYLLDWGACRPGWRFLSVFDEVESFCRQLARCRLVVASCLHGLILADAYGIPSVRVVMSDRLGGDGIKFRDYFAAAGRDIGRTLPWRNAERMTEADLAAAAEVGKADTDPLLHSCPITRST